MLPPEIEALLSRFNRNPPVDPDALARFAARSSFALPQAYSRFLGWSDGGEGFVGASYVILWRLEELLPFNADHGVAEFAPGLFLFGSDGGGEAFAFDARLAGRPIVSVPFIPMELAEARRLADDFDGFLAALASAE